MMKCNGNASKVLFPFITSKITSNSLIMLRTFTKLEGTQQENYGARSHKNLAGEEHLDNFITYL